MRRIITLRGRLLATEVTRGVSIVQQLHERFASADALLSGLRLITALYVRFFLLHNKTVHSRQ